jgi:dihydroneopterin aldolase / 2-amino-4-hydroxy-6-hydroxymethyldihydropteridine diphosphokinase / dihydropteroate synthase
MGDKIFIRDLRVNCVIGCGPDERVKRQPLVINVTLHVDIAACGDSDSLHDTVNYSAVAKRLAALVERSRCYTLEALATALAADVLTADDCRRVESVTVRLDKPEAFAKLPAVPCVEITRPRSYFSGARQRQDSSVWRADAVAAAAAAASSSPAAASPAAAASTRSDGVVTAYLAIGSNVGDRVANIKAALRLLQAVPDPAAAAAAAAAGAAGSSSAAVADDLSPTGRKRRRPFLTVKETSFLYETPPAYVLDQPPFLNGALAVETNLPPSDLLAHIKANVEGAMGREKTLRFGPRNIDVDILLYGPNAVVEVPEGGGDGGRLPLSVPHPRLAERDFALGPLADLCPGLMHPTLHCSIVDLLARLPAVNLTRVLPLPSRPLGPAGAGSNDAAAAAAALSPPQERLLRLGGRTHVVGILNVTPDSFSDGGEHFAAGDAHAAADAAVRHAVAMVAAGADVIDIGGQSTRPGADMLPPDVEAARVVPAIAAIRRALPGVPLSVDTFHASVARAAVGAGADIINDVSGGLLDAAMLKTAAELEVRAGSVWRRGCGSGGAAARR